MKIGDDRRRLWADRWARRVILLLSLTAIATIVLIFIFIFREALPILTDPEIQREASLRHFFRPTEGPDLASRYMWQPIALVPKYSLIPLILGTLKTTLVALLIAAPLAIAAALYTSEFAPARVRETIKPAIELLAGIPSVVLGFFALIVLATWIQQLFGLETRLNAITAGTALALALIPIIYTVSEDALNAVPQSLREASLALGATRWQTATRVVLPAALPGIFASLILGFGRAVGETMIVLMASGNAAITSWQFTDSVRTLAATIAAELGEVVFGSPHYHVLFFIGALLFVVTFIVNSVGMYIIHRVQHRLRGGL
ncbi:MAG: phosphate ABC transporter permease subunit PstC [Blastocatellia bacterium]|nr:phosphate ABC transporter permease subunit PstC [Blastocatellia bacterium]MCX7751317.1 phosphate ABC transporter permease subunit PstC [Blastocatellia bacterium]MDW8256390.1 phosphate ABC transporter permease subunit PstC [Acidobacteriota bacterium]